MTNRRRPLKAARRRPRATEPPAEQPVPLTPEQIEEILDEAVQDGRISADHVEHWRKLLEVDPEGTIEALEALPPGRFDNTLANAITTVLHNLGVKHTRSR
ncbi:hypothetical protein [Gordonia sp. MP11Mi]|uniref:Uncharacterized protein n=1 Tax=Gordonia sp. MP11Mi TaxID=3022769 RepID=A0AA97CUF7_9ACTN